MAVPILVLARPCDLSNSNRHQKKERIMEQQEWMGVVDLTSEEAYSVAGGVVPLAALVLGAFGAGFRFGFGELGPIICG